LCRNKKEDEKAKLEEKKCASKEKSKGKIYLPRQRGAAKVEGRGGPQKKGGGIFPPSKRSPKGNVALQGRERLNRVYKGV